MSSELDDYFSRFTYQPTPAAGTRPEEVVWKRVGRIEIGGSRLYIGDSWAIASESIEVPIAPGVYDIDAQCFSYGTDGRVAVLRGRLQGSNPEGSREAGEFGVDAASAGFIDADALDRWTRADQAAYEAWQESFSEAGVAEVAGFFACEAIGSAMVHSSTGFGDGVYRVATLLEGDRPVGFEARFLEDGQGYFDAGSRVRAQLDRPRTLKERLSLLWTVPLAFGALVVGVTLGVVGLVFLKLAKLLKRLR
jgi:hypothetical protein